MFNSALQRRRRRSVNRHARLALYAKDQHETSIGRRVSRIRHRIYDICELRRRRLRYVETHPLERPHFRRFNLSVVCLAHGFCAVSFAPHSIEDGHEEKNCLFPGSCYIIEHFKL